ncbi:hypothetical protein, partial [Chitinimonas sp.]|uniref:hypothetical protein n=1 Tax=Chitinimonas sp. TaxID=1934313 RepID=UPI0035B4F9A2
MGMNYTYEVIARKESADRLVRAICEHLVPDDKARLLSALDLGAADIHRNIFREDWEQPFNHIFLSFAFAEDEILVEYEKGESDNGAKLQEASQGRMVQIDSVWTDITVGDDYVRVRATAATSRMSGLFSASSSINKAFCDIAESGGALLVIFDYEELYYAAVWPKDDFEIPKYPE